jgi:hypothetical protein
MIINTKFIEVPQAGYAMITPDTDESCGGLCTRGLQNCCAITGKGGINKDFYLYLCHAHMFTDLENGEHGVLGWIEEMIRKNCMQIEITCDDILAKYETSLKKIIDKTKQQYPSFWQNGGKIDLICKDAKNYRSAIIKRIDGCYEQFVELPGNIIPVPCPLSVWIGPLMERGYPPICVYDGTHKITLEEFKKIQPQLFKRLVVLEHCQYYDRDISQEGLPDDKLDLIIKYYEQKKFKLELIGSNIDDGNIEKQLNGGFDFAEMNTKQYEQKV